MDNIEKNPSPQQTSGTTVTAFVLGILSILVPYVGFVLGIIAIILGKKALNRIKQTGEPGHGLALAGFICGIVGTALYALIIGFFVVAFIFFEMSTSDLEEVSIVTNLLVAV
ncbi:DUF4190 domain-containing protein [Paenibacillus swuensis]|uniref:DUF4190 domain-containing protein n=1 Tax=Paenibacillus swuensis TaxID=1178515 RepID=UPI000A836FC4|nr:DUF4190 domain-containing protein [Paenibacillus swuensis]